MGWAELLKNKLGVAIGVMLIDTKDYFLVCQHKN